MCTGIGKSEAFYFWSGKAWEHGSQTEVEQGRGQFWRWVEAA